MLRARDRSRPVVEDPETVWKGTVDMVNFSEVKALMHLELTYNSFGGVIPDTNGSLNWIYNLQSLHHSFCNLSGVSPFSSLKNLTSLSHISMFLYFHTPSWISSHTSPVSLDLTDGNQQIPFPPQGLTLSGQQ
eukprot:Gb_31203 [translate_table: standard]